MINMLYLLITISLIATVRADNPFERGCLYSKNLATNVRVCGSDDPPEAAMNGICRADPMDYEEIRLLPSDWESTFFESWILQIALSELLNVPTSLEMGDPSLQLNFYHPDSPMDAPAKSDYKDSLETAYRFNGDCSRADRSEGSYEVCGHINPESWGARNSDVQTMVSRGVIETPNALGMITQEGWFIPKFTAERDPSLLSYFGLQNNPQKLADRFLRPTTWKDYCDVVSKTNCTAPDGVAQRAPLNEEEYKMMFAEDTYTGHFRATEKNNCSLNNENSKCTGHIADYPCGWSSTVPSQIHYLNISLDPDMELGGYEYSQLIQIWKAANATQSDVIMYWWTQDLLYDEFFGTEAEMIKVTMPAPTQECIDSRPEPAHRCSNEFDLRVGPPEAVCGEPPKNLHAVVSTTVYDQGHDGLCPARYSPSHTALMSYQLSELQLEEINAHWLRLGDPRKALCEWVSENMDYMERFVPRTYPRTLVKKDEKGPLRYASTILGIVVMVLVVLTMTYVHRNKDKKAILYAQIEFLDLLLLGSLLIAVGAILMALPSSNFTCITSIWLINLGYTLELLPLIVKVGALLHVMKLGKRMQRVQIKREMLFGAVTLISIFVSVYCLVWTLLDGPKPTPEHELTDEINDDGETIVWQVDVCASQSLVWSYVSVGWNATLLFITTVLAVRMRNLTVRGFNEAPTLALLVYSHLFFVILRVITYLLASSVSGHTLARCLSLIFSADTTATLIIYFVPKFLAEEEMGGSTIRISGSGFNQSTDWYSARFSNGGANEMRRGFSMSRETRESEAPAAFEPVGAVEAQSSMFCCSTKSRSPSERPKTATSAVIKDSREESNPSPHTESPIQRRLSQNLQRQLSNWIVMDEEDFDDPDEEEAAQATAPSLLDGIEKGGLLAPAELASLMDEIERLERKTNSLQVEKDFQASRLIGLEEENTRLKNIELLSESRFQINHSCEAKATPAPLLSDSSPEVMPTAA